MAYFIAGYLGNSKNIENYYGHFELIIPNYIRQNKIALESKNTFCRIYGIQKAINDIFYHDQETGSWISIIGTPLITGNLKDKKHDILKNFLKNPVGFIKNEIDGCWCLIAYDALNSQFYTCTDLENTIPIYYATRDSSVYISSHELPLAKFLGYEIDPAGFSMAIHLKLTWGTYTRFKNIYKMLPAQIFIYDDQKRRHGFQYWKPSEEKLLNFKFDDAIDYFISILNNSVQSFYSNSNNKTVVCDVTGGEDSRLVLSSVHQLKIPFIGLVDGNPNDLDVIIANNLAKAGGFQLIIRPKPDISEVIILDTAINTVLFVDGYEDYLLSFIVYLINSSEPNISYTHIKYGGAPGGEVFRGSYYLRGKALFPSSSRRFDHLFFTKMKFFLDFMPGLLRYPDDNLKAVLLTMIEESLEEVLDFPVGTKIDHILRLFQTCNTGLIYKTPRYLPLATRELTKAIYNIPPKFKRGGRLTKACTELLFPEIANVQTQKGVPTIRKTFLRAHKFIPEYNWTLKYISSGIFSRFLKWRDSAKPGLSWKMSADALRALLTKPPYCNWFASSKTMVTGDLYSPDPLNRILKEAKQNKTFHVSTIGRILFQEIAARWVYNELDF